MKALFTGKSIAICALSVLTGVMALQFLSGLPDPAWLQYLPLCVLLALFSPNFRLPLLLCSGFLYAMLHASLHFRQVLPESLAGQDILVSGVIADIPLIHEHVQRFELEVEQGELPCRRLRLNWYGAPQQPRAGERWQFKVRLKPPHGAMNPGGFDYEQSLYQQGIQATGYVREDPLNRRLAPADIGSVDAMRQNITDSLRAGRYRYPGLLAALAVGYTGDVTPEQWDVMVLTGTNHLIAISGSHVSLVAGIMYWLMLRAVPVSWLRRAAAHPVAAGVALLAAGFYALLAGFSVPPQRALIMLAVVLGAILLRRRVSVANTLGAALLAVLLFDPLACLSAGFWFSFLAVMVIFYGHSARLRAGGWWWRWGRIQWLITLGLLPVTLFLFQQTSLVAPMANLFMVPWVTLVIVPVLLLGVLLLPLWPFVSNLMFELADTSLNISWPALDWLAHVPLATWVQPAPGIAAMVLAMIGVAVLMMPRGMPQRWLGVVMVLPMFMQRPEPPATGEFRATVIDVGQGLSVFVQTHTHDLLFDTGMRFSDDSDAGERMVLPFLHHSGVRSLHLLILSNSDADHSGGAQSILQNLRVEAVAGQDMDAVAHGNKHLCRAGERWHWDGVEFTFLHPDQYETKSNNRSCVLKIDNGDESLLIAADIEQKVEKRLLQTAASDVSASVLVVPHHGSKTSSGTEWISAVHPRYALISAGYRNRYGHPKPEVVQRYVEAGSVVLNTADTGAITLYFDHQPGLEPQSWRQLSHHYWNAPYSH
jgi:competence protein ComEC